MKNGITFASGRGADGSGGRALALQSPRVGDVTPMARRAQVKTTRFREK